MNVSDQVQAIAARNFVFSSSLDEQLGATENGNLVFSPFSLALVLAMVRLGARGTTAKEMDAAIGFPSDIDAIKDGYVKALMSIGESSKGFNLTIANKMFMQTGFDIRGEFVEDVKKTFNTTVRQLSFANATEAAGIINGWVSNQTHGKIKELFTAESLSDDTKLVLVNAIFFKAGWKKPFDSNQTRKAPFYVTATENAQVDMMFASESLAFGELDHMNATVVVLPYKGQRFSMYVYVPKQKDGLELVRKGLKKSAMADIFTKITPATACREVKLYLPRFKIESKLNLVEPLKQMGAVTMFSKEKADFSDIVQSRDSAVYVTDVVQRAVINVDEHGTEAAAASGVQFKPMCLPQTTEVKADRPFYYQIVDEKTKIIIFAGFVRNPNK